MKSKRQYEPALLVIFLSCTALSGCNEKQKEQVRRSWDSYAAAATAGDGQTAVSWLNENTIAFYDRVRREALESSAEQVRALPLTEKMFVLLTRINVDPAYLRKLDGGQLIMVGMRDGWMNNAGDPKALTLDDIQIEGDRATAQVSANGKVLPFRFLFTREGGVWKQDLPSILEFMDSKLRDTMTRAPAGMTEDQMILLAVGMQSRKQIGPEIWDKPSAK